jgi:hypothetical protein
VLLDEFDFLEFVVVHKLRLRFLEKFDEIIVLGFEVIELLLEFLIVRIFDPMPLGWVRDEIDVIVV